MNAKPIRSLRLAFVILITCFGAAQSRASDLSEARPFLLAAAPVESARLVEADLTGKPVIVTFFASWCPPCTDEFLTLNQIRADHGPDRLGIVAVNAFEAWGGKKNPVRMARFLARTRPEFPMVESSGEILRVFGNVERIPTLIIYDAEGREVWRFVHEVDATKRSASVEDIRSVLARFNLP